MTGIFPRAAVHKLLVIYRNFQNFAVQGGSIVARLRRQFGTKYSFLLQRNHGGLRRFISKGHGNSNES